MSRTTRRWTRSVYVLTLLVAVMPVRAEAFQSRDTAVREALDAFDLDRARDILEVVLNPDSGFGDPLWQRGVQWLAEILIATDEAPEMAAIWLRWALRLDPTMAPDSNRIDRVLEAFETAVATVGRDTVGRETSWSWPVGVRPRGQGALIVRPSPFGAQVLIEGQFMATPGQPAPLPAGSYTVIATAEGFEPASITREVLPGVTTTVSVTLTPAPVTTAADSVLPESVAEAARRRTVRIRSFRLGEPGCAAGVVVNRDGLVLTTYDAIRGAEEVEVRLHDGIRFTDETRVAGYEISSNLAVLSVPAQATDWAPVVADPDAGFAWAVRYRDCDVAELFGPLRAAWTGGPDDALRVDTTLSGAPPGAPLLDRSGAVIGLASASAAPVAVADASALITEARTAIGRGDVLRPRDVAIRENHRYGSTTILSRENRGIVEVTPLEPWHWPELAQSGPQPLTFVGPVGRYRANLLVDGEQLAQEIFTVQPGTRGQVAISVSTRGGGFPAVAILGIIGAGGAAAAALALGGAGGGDNGGGGPPAPTTGGIIINYPVP